jgi:hypothetical protein
LGVGEESVTMNDWLVYASVYLQQHSGQRLGQAYFNSLCEHRPDISEQIRCTINDPFYNDNKLDDFFKKVEELWTTA